MYFFFWAIKKTLFFQFMQTDTQAKLREHQMFISILVLVLRSLERYSKAVMLKEIFKMISKGKCRYIL